MEKSLTKWDKRFLELARFYAQWSKDPSTQVGCVIAKGNNQISQGYNGYPKRVADNDLDNRELKYRKIIHAEVNAILFARTDLTDCTLYNWPLPPCERCATLIIQSQITRVVTVTLSHENGRIDRWDESTKLALQMFQEIEIPVEMYHEAQLKGR